MLHAREVPMRHLCWIGFGALIFGLIARDGVIPGRDSSSSNAPIFDPIAGTPRGPIAAMGRTQCVPGRRASIAPVPLHPVVEVKVAPGEHVKKGQLLVKLDDDEARADVRQKKALLESAQYSLNEAKRFLAKALAHREILPEQRLHEAELAVRKAEADERAAQAALDSSEAELEHFSVAAVIDGIVSWLDVYPGLVSRPGTSLWGEIVDLRELDVRCELTPQEADEVALGQEVEVRTDQGEPLSPHGRLIFIGPVADAKSGLVPVLVRWRNPDQRVRCGVTVSVRFSGFDQAMAKK
jgi:RND family efflux transporter MFP subunit